MYLLQGDSADMRQKYVVFHMYSWLLLIMPIMFLLISKCIIPNLSTWIRHLVQPPQTKVSSCAEVAAPLITNVLTSLPQLCMSIVSNWVCQIVITGFSFISTTYDIKDSNMIWNISWFLQNKKHAIFS